jgi:hypothetical protein
VEIGLESSKINFERLQKLEFLSDMTPADVELLLSYLYHAGFLTVKEDYKSLGDDQLHAVIVPNNETRSALLDLITEHYMGTCGFSLAQLDEVSITISKLLYSKNDCNVKPLKEAFTELIRPIQLAKFDSAGR